ncbi:MAG: tripartite tricarboxylate transporter TctB family protein [Thermodesulfobacteriota bacterium]
MKYGGKLLNIFLFIVSVGYVLIGLNFSRTPRTFPLLVGFPMIVLTGLQTLIDFFPNISKKYSDLGTFDAEMISGRTKGQKTENNPDQYQKELEIFLWLAVAVALILLLGILFGLPLFIFIYLKYRYVQGWKVSLSLPLGALAAMYIIFTKVLTISLYKGIFFRG